MNNQTCKWAAVLLLPAVLWIEVIRQLRIEWTINPQYTYGWSVPFLALYLFLLRWKDRPAPWVSTQDASAHWRSMGLLVLFFLLLLPLRMVQEANPGWRLVPWAMTMDVVGMTFCLIYLAGGGAWARHFAFPILFFFVAVPWPSALENVVIQNFTRANATATVEVLNMLGVAAAQRGNVIEVATGVVGIDEACSGIRSFQAALMIALFLGEWNRFRWAQRWVLLGGAVVIVFLANSVRTYFLVWVAAKKSIAAIAKWHDPAGVSVLVIAFGLIWLLAALLKRRGKNANEKGDPADRQFNSPTVQSPAGQWPRFLVAGGIIWVVVCELATLFWFRAHERRAGAAVTWTVRWPEEKAGFHDRGFTPVEREMLKYTEGRAASWSEGDGSGWLVFFLRWKNPSSLMERVVAHDALMHQPDICLPGAGFRMVADEGIRTFDAGGIAVPFRRQRFEARGAALYVFHCVWEDTLSRAREGDIDWMERNPWRATKIRLQRAWDGKRYNGIRVLEIALAGVDSQRTADERMGARLGTLLRLESGE